MLAGWYHSHPVSQPKPSHNDVISQKAYQEFVRSSTGDEPLVGFIISEGISSCGYITHIHVASSPGSLWVEWRRH